MKNFGNKKVVNDCHKKAAKQVRTMDLAITNRVSVPAALYEEVKANVILNLPFLQRLDYIVPEDLVGLNSGVTLMTGSSVWQKPASPIWCRPGYCRLARVKPGLKPPTFTFWGNYGFETSNVEMQN
jgi:hypothetical protein